MRLRIEIEVSEEKAAYELENLAKNIRNAQKYGWRYPCPIINEQGEMLGTISERHVLS